MPSSFTTSKVWSTPEPTSRMLELQRSFDTIDRLAGPSVLERLRVLEGAVTALQAQNATRDRLTAMGLVFPSRSVWPLDLRNKPV